MLAPAALALVPAYVEAQARRPRVDQHEGATESAPVPKSMTQLLDEGWRTGAYNNYQTKTFENNENAFFIIPTDGGKYIICMLDDPTMNDADAKRRALD